MQGFALRLQSYYSEALLLATQVQESVHCSLALLHQVVKS